jgi:hypothetical protein
MRGVSDNTELEAQVSGGMSSGSSDGRSITPTTLSERLAEVRALSRPS